jgi:hypothetical protein
MTTPKLIDIALPTRCMCCGVVGTPCVYVLGHSDVYARAWPICTKCLPRVAASVEANALHRFADLPPEPADSEWLNERMGMKPPPPPPPPEPPTQSDPWDDFYRGRNPRRG